MAQSQSAAHCNAACKNIPRGGGAGRAGRQAGGQAGGQAGRQEGRKQRGDLRSNLPSFPLTPPPPAQAQKILDQRQLSMCHIRGPPDMMSASEGERVIEKRT